MLKINIRLLMYNQNIKDVYLKTMLNWEVYSTIKRPCKRH